MTPAPTGLTLQVSTRLPYELVSEVERLARSERRSISNLLRLAVEDWVAARRSKARREQHEAAA
jgi:predicted transcriptional regulator